MFQFTVRDLAEVIQSSVPCTDRTVTLSVHTLLYSLERYTSTYPSVGFHRTRRQVH